MASWARGLEPARLRDLPLAARPGVLAPALIGEISSFQLNLMACKPERAARLRPRQCCCPGRAACRGPSRRQALAGLASLPAGGPRTAGAPPAPRRSGRRRRPADVDGHARPKPGRRCAGRGGRHAAAVAAADAAARGLAAPRIPPCCRASPLLPPISAGASGRSGLLASCRCSWTGRTIRPSLPCLPGTASFDAAGTGGAPGRMAAGDDGGCAGHAALPFDAVHPWRCPGACSTAGAQPLLRAASRAPAPAAVGAARPAGGPVRATGPLRRTSRAQRQLY